MAGLGEDTTAATFHILEEPDFNVYIPEHVLTLPENYALVYMLLLMSICRPLREGIKPPGLEMVESPPAIDRLQNERN